MKVTDDDINFSQKCKSNDERRKSYSAVIKENTFKQPNNHSTTSSYPQPVPNSLSAKSEVVKNEVEHVSVIGKEVPLLAPNQEVWEQTSRRRKKPRGILKDSQCSERTPDRTITFSIEQTSPACDVLIEPQNENVENYEKENMNERMEGKKKNKKKRSKINSSDVEENPLVKRIMISDDQVINFQILTLLI